MNNNELVYNIIIDILKNTFKSEVEFGCYIDSLKDQLLEKRQGILLKIDHTSIFIELKQTEKIINKDFYLYKTSVIVSEISLHNEKINELSVFNVIKSSNEFTIENISDIYKIIKEIKNLLNKNSQNNIIDGESKEKIIANWLSIFAV